MNQVVPLLSANLCVVRIIVDQKFLGLNFEMYFVPYNFGLDAGST